MVGKMPQQSVTIEKISTVATGTTEVIFKTPQPFLFTAGQYITVTLPSLKHLPIKEQFRDFSIASSPEDSERVAIAFRNSESHFKKELLRGDKTAHILIEGPKGIFTLPEDFGTPVVLVAGGIGITPFLSMIRHIRTVKIPLIMPALFYYNRDRESAPYLSELEGYGGSLQIISIFGKMAEKEIAAYLEDHPEKSMWYLCGPRGLINTAREILTRLRVDDLYINSEEFSGYE